MALLQCDTQGFDERIPSTLLGSQRELIVYFSAVKALALN